MNLKNYFIKKDSQNKIKIDFNTFFYNYTYINGIEYGTSNK